MPSRERGRRLERSETGVNLGDAHFASIFRASTRDLRIVIVTKNQLPNVLMRTFDQISEIKHSHENVWQLIFWCKVSVVDAGQARHLPPVVVIPLVDVSSSFFILDPLCEEKN